MNNKELLSMLKKEKENCMKYIKYHDSKEYDSLKEYERYTDIHYRNLKSINEDISRLICKN